MYFPTTYANIIFPTTDRYKNRYKYFNILNIIFLRNAYIFNNNYYYPYF